jgi:hypothetical protein
MEENLSSLLFHKGTRKWGLSITGLPIKELVQRHGYMSHNFDNNKERSYEDIPMSLSVS